MSVEKDGFIRLDNCLKCGFRGEILYKANISAIISIRDYIEYTNYNPTDDIIVHHKSLVYKQTCKNLREIR